MINRVVLTGRLTKDPELRFTPSGIPMVRFTLAVNRTFSNNQGEREADFINCIAWRKQAENLANFQRKGALIGVEGRIQTGSYEGQDGKRVYTTDVVADNIHFLEKRSDSQQGGTYNAPPKQQEGGYQQPNNNQSFGGGQPSNSYGFGTGQPQEQQNYTRMDEDPFANSKGPVEVKEDDLPF